MEPKQKAKKRVDGSLDAFFEARVPNVTAKPRQVKPKKNPAANTLYCANQ
jgi:hypothetical protein